MNQMQGQPNFNYITNPSSNPMPLNQMNPTQLQIEQQNLRANYGAMSYMQQQQQRPYENINPSSGVPSGDNRNMNQFMLSVPQMLQNPGGQGQALYGGMISNPTNNLLMQNNAPHTLPTLSNKLIMSKGADSSNLALFRVPSNATNSIYVDGNYIP
mgnify:CR=1 FL=1